MRRRPLIAAVAAGVVLVAGCGVAYAQTQNSSGSYRTATVAVGSVDKTLSLAGAITASARRDLSFGADGTIAKVAVAAGDGVRSGATLATLDATELTAAVTKARATLARAKAQLETDQTSQAAAVSAAASSSTVSSAKKEPSSSPTSSSPSSPSSGSTTSPPLTKALAQLKGQQGAVTTAQTAATEALAAAKTALAAQVAACTAPAETAEPDAADPEGADPGEAPAAGVSTECATALDAVQAAQDVVATKQDALQAALQTLAGTLADAVKALGTPAGSTGSVGNEVPSPAPTNTPDPSSSGGSSGGPAGIGGGETVTAATLAKDQAAIDTAEAQLAEADQTRQAAELTAPFAGEILSVSVAKGDSIATSDVVIVMVGNGSTTATTTVPLDQVAQVKKGQLAQVTPAGAAQPVAGKVTSIGLLPDTTSDTSNYPVTIDLDGEVTAPEGSSASISLVTGTAKNVLTVPSSAVSTTGRTTVSVLAGGTVTRTPVTVGVVGPTRTEISEGVKKGQVIVLADLDAALPSGDGSTSRLPGARGGFGGGGMPGSFRAQGGGRG